MAKERKLPQSRLTPSKADIKAKIRELEFIKEEGNELDDYQRGALDALTWAVGENAEFLDY